MAGDLGQDGELTCAQHDHIVFRGDLVHGAEKGAVDSRRREAKWRFWVDMARSARAVLRERKWSDGGRVWVGSDNYIERKGEEGGKTPRKKKL